VKEGLGRCKKGCLTQSLKGKKRKNLKSGAMGKSINLEEGIHGLKSENQGAIKTGSTDGAELKRRIMSAGGSLD